MKKQTTLIIGIFILLLFSNCTVSKLFNKNIDKTEQNSKEKSKQEINVKEQFNGFLDVAGSELLADVNTNIDENSSSNDAPQIFENGDTKVTFTNNGKGKGKIKVENKPKKIEISGSRETNIKNEGEKENNTKETHTAIHKEKKTDNSKFIAAGIVMLLLLILFARKWIKSKLSIFKSL